VRQRRAAVALTVACGVTFLLLGSVATPAVGQTGDPVADADQAVAAAQAEVDRVAAAYFDALDRTQQLEARIRDTQGRIDVLRQQVAQLKQTTSDRAVAAYKRSGTSLGIAFDSSSAADTVRRVKVLDFVNARDDDAVDLLRKSQDALSGELSELDTAREEQSAAVARLREEGDQVNAKLVDAQNRRQAAIEQEQQLGAQRQAEAAAAAAAAAANAAAAAARPPTPPPSSPAPVPVPAPAPAAAAAAVGPPPTGGVHPQHNNPYLKCVRFYESTNNYQAYNPGGPAYGAYQFLKPTWNLAANRAGRGDLVGIDPRRASEYDQDDMAWTLYQWQGAVPWGGLCQDAT